MITGKIQGLEPGDFVRLYELDYTAQGGEVLRFHNYDAETLYWKGEAYEPWAVEASGFAKVGNGQQPTPTLKVGNIGRDAAGNPISGVITALCLAYGDLRGAKLICRKTLAEYLDAVNFPNGNPSANPDEEFQPEQWQVECKLHEEPAYVEFELKSAIDFDNFTIPSRRVIPICQWLERGGYRGPYCGYTGAEMFTRDDEPTNDPTLDRCSGKVSSCKLRFGEFNELSHGGCPGADSLRGY